MSARTGTSFWPNCKDHPQVSHNLARFGRLIERVVERGGEILTQVLPQGNAQPLAEHYLPVLMCYRHAMELLAAVAGLIKQSSADPCSILLRVVFESVLHIEYILEADPKKRGMAFLVCDVHDRIRRCDMLDPNTPLGKQCESSVLQDQALSGDTLLARLREFDYTTERADMKQVLASRAYKKAEQEYQRIKKSRNNRPKWHQLFGGPESVEQLAKHLKSGGLYSILYRQWSGAVHGTDLLSGKIKPGARDQVGIMQINSPQNAQQFTVFAVSLGLRMHKNIVGKWIPNKRPEQDCWYDGKIRQEFVELSNRQVISVL